MKKVLKLKDAEFSVLSTELNKLIGKKQLIIFGNCSSLFDGRIKSVLLNSDRTLIIKKDLSIVLHDPLGVKPVQWQLPKAGDITFTHVKKKDRDILRMETWRPKTDESFFISFSEIYSIYVYSPQIVSSTSSVIGNEKDFQEFLSNNLDMIEENLNLVTREKEIDFGFIDILAKDQNENMVAIEIKKQAAVLQDAHQVKRYIDYYKKNNEVNIRGILVATKIPNKVQKYLDTYGLEGVSVSWQDIFPTLQRPKSIKKSKSLDKFL